MRPGTVRLHSILMFFIRIPMGLLIIGLGGHYLYSQLGSGTDLVLKISFLLVGVALLIFGGLILYKTNTAYYDEDNLYYSRFFFRKVYPLQSIAGLQTVYTRFTNGLGLEIIPADGPSFQIYVDPKSKQAKRAFIQTVKGAQPNAPGPEKLLLFCQSCFSLLQKTAQALELDFRLNISGVGAIKSPAELEDTQLSHPFLAEVDLANREINYFIEFNASEKSLYTYVSFSGDDRAYNFAGFLNVLKLQVGVDVVLESMPVDLQLYMSDFANQLPLIHQRALSMGFSGVHRALFKNS